MIVGLVACTQFVEPGAEAPTPARLEDGTWSRERILDQTPHAERIDWTMAIGFDLAGDVPLFGFGLTDLLGTNSTNWIRSYVYALDAGGDARPTLLEAERRVSEGPPHPETRDAVAALRLRLRRGP